MIDAAWEAFRLLVEPQRLGWLGVGVLFGMVVGIVPGLSGTVGMAILIPLVIGMDPLTALALMMGMAAVLHTSDTFPSILLGVPGSSAAQATIMDGYPMARRGEAKQALGAAFFVSMIGGVIGAISLMGSVVVMRPLVLSLGTPDLFMLTMLGLSVVASLTRGSVWAGLTAGFLGLLLGSVGFAPAAPEYRYTFDLMYLRDGLPLASLALGLFAIPELVDLCIEKRSVTSEVKLGGSMLDGIRRALRHKMLIVRSSLIGTTVGIIPGLGGSVVDWLAYGVANQTTTKDNKFGQGDIRGLIAPESANNAKEAGALIPTLLFGIPGGGTTAMLLGALVVFGLVPGPQMVTTSLSTTMLIAWTFVFGSIAAAALCMVLTPQIAKITLTPGRVLFPFVITLLTFAAYQFTGQWGDVITFLVIGAFGWFMKQVGWPRPPMLIGFVLAIPAERYFYISYSRYGWTWLRWPSVIGIGIVALVLVIMTATFGARASAKGAAVTSEPGLDDASSTHAREEEA